MITEANRPGSILKYEADENYSREVVTIAKGQNLKMGTVVGEVSASGEYKAVSVSESETDGSDTALGVLFADVDATAEATQGVIITRDAIVIGSALVYPDGITEDQKKKVIKDLENRGVVTRKLA